MTDVEVGNLTCGVVGVESNGGCVEGLKGVSGEGRIEMDDDVSVNVASVGAGAPNGGLGWFWFWGRGLRGFKIFKGEPLKGFSNKFRGGRFARGVVGSTGRA